MEAAVRGGSCKAPCSFGDLPLATNRGAGGPRPQRVTRADSVEHSELSAVGEALRPGTGRSPGEPPTNKKSLPNLAVEQGPNRGWECATLSFPVAGIRRPIGCRLPDAILQGQWSCLLRPRSRAVQRLALAEFRVRPLSSLGMMVAPPACEPGQDKFGTLLPRLEQLAPGRPPRLAVRWPGATGLTSYLSGCLSLTSQRCVFETPPTFWKSFGPGLDPRILPGFRDSLCPPFGVFGSAGFSGKPPERSVPCWRTVATKYLSG